MVICGQHDDEPLDTPDDWTILLLSRRTVYGGKLVGKKTERKDFLMYKQKRKPVFAERKTEVRHLF